MIRFHVTARTAAGAFIYTTLAPSSIDAHAAAIDRFGPCSVAVRPE